MTPEQQTMAKALNQCALWPGTNTRRFAADMAHLAEHDPGREITPKQAEFLRTAVIRYRRQIPRDVVEIAKSLAPETETAP
jgi:hypothetical protein